MKRAVLILAGADEPHAVALQWALTRMGMAVEFSGGLAHWHGRDVAVEIGPMHLRLRDSENPPVSVWNRRPQAPKPKPGLPEDQAFLAGEWRSFHENLIATALQWAPSFWVNAPAAARNAENKLLQLVAARKVGLAFPETVMGNDTEAVRRLAQRGRIVFKAFRPYAWQENGGRSTVTTILDSGNLPDAQVIELCPGIYQHYVEKVADIRVTVAGSRLLAAKLQKRSGDAYIDWRTHVFEQDFLAEQVTLPAALEQRIHALMASLGLVFGCLDFVIDSNGVHHFLEINQAGQFLFLEDLLPDIGILRMMASFLAAGVCEYPIIDDASLTMAEFRSSETYAALARRLHFDEPLSA
jgi:glutathione synthase/RimK-type ligase-like ATP-grasp enzyme